MKTLKSEHLLMVLIAAVAALLVADTGLFLRINQLENRMSSSQVQQRVPESLQVGTAAPSLILPDLHGHDLSLGDYLGQKVLLGFALATCEPCKRALPDLKTFSKQHPETKVVLVLIGSDKERSDLVAAQDLQFPVLKGTREHADVFKVPAVPFFYLIDESGSVIRGGQAPLLSELASVWP